MQDLLTELPEDIGEIDEDELVRRAAVPRSETISAGFLLDAMDEAAGRPVQQRYYDEVDLPPYDLRFDPRVAERIESFGDYNPDFVPLIAKMRDDLQA